MKFYIGPDREDMFPASEAKGFLLVDKKEKQTSFYLETNGNGKLNKKKDLLITTDGFEKALYKSKKGSLHATNSQEAMIDALTGLSEGHHQKNRILRLKQDWSSQIKKERQLIFFL